LKHGESLKTRDKYLLSTELNNISTVTPCALTAS